MTICKLQKKQYDLVNKIKMKYKYIKTILTYTLRLQDDISQGEYLEMSR
jgi:hypothetical protein